jgi:integrase
VEFDRGLLIVAGSKTGKLIRPLGAAAAAILDGIEKKVDCDFVFPADTGDRAFPGANGIWRKIVIKAKPESVTPHTLRQGLSAIQPKVEWRPHCPLGHQSR